MNKIENILILFLAVLITFSIFLILPQLTKKNNEFIMPLNFSKTYFDVLSETDDITEPETQTNQTQNLQKKNEQPEKNIVEQPPVIEQTIPVKEIEPLIEEKKIEEKIFSKEIESRPELIESPKKNPETENIEKIPEKKIEYITPPKETPSNNDNLQRSNSVIQPQKNESPKTDLNFDGNRIFEEKELDKPPAAIRRVKPDYPYIARELNKTGIVKLSFIINQDGQISDIKIIGETEPGVFSKSALNALNKWRFTPGILNGKKVSARVTLDFKFSLE